MLARVIALVSILLCAPVLAITTGAQQPEKYLPLLKNKRVALVVNQTSRVGDQHLVDFLLSKGIKIVSVMAPEHGFRGEAADGATIHDNIDPATGLPVLSIYGKTKKPSAHMLANVDTLIFDIQDVGTRFYTFISTLHYVMEAAAEQHKTVLVLDRPNPNGRYIDGPMREPGFESFVGLDPLPLLHGLTVGELARMIKGEGWINQADALDLRVIAVAGYSKQDSYSLPVAPSPNLPNDTAIRLYPSLCLFEGTAVSVGRGTDAPFQQIGHDKVVLGNQTFTPVSMTSSTSPKLEGKTLHGRSLVNSTIQGFDLQLIADTYQAFKQANEVFFTRPGYFDKLAGTDKLRLALEAGKSVEEITASWQADLTAFNARRQPYLLYPLN